MEAISAECSRLGASYAGDKAAEITRREAEVAEAWAALQQACAARRDKLEDADHLYRFLSQARTLTLWMDDVVRQMNTGEKPRSVCVRTDYVNGAIIRFHIPLRVCLLQTPVSRLYLARCIHWSNLL